MSPGRRHGLRLIGAGLFVFAGMFGGVVLLMLLGPAKPPAWLTALAMFATLAIAVSAAMWLFGGKGSDPFGRLTAAQHIARLEQMGLLADDAFEATRAFAIDEYEDEGLSYYIELSDGRVLFLTGQYLYDYEPANDDDEDARSRRRFPCTAFVVRRHKAEGYVVDLACNGDAFEPEVVTQPFSPTDWAQNRVPADGDIVAGKSYDQIKAERIAATRR